MDLPASQPSFFAFNPGPIFVQNVEEHVQDLCLTDGDISVDIDATPLCCE
jgi:hypothetical protein